METMVDMIDKVLMNVDDSTVIQTVQNEVKEFLHKFPLYPELG